MTPYKTNSALYLDYLASVRTREQIEADPRLCVFLNNEYIKDNMEVALLYNAAKTGDYSDKMSFVEYFMCNSPELDADTILHYRTKIALDPVCTEIAYSYYTDNIKLEELRKTKYNKKKDNCFTKPCFYMGRFSAGIGKWATYENAGNMWNCFADAWFPTAEEKQARTNQNRDTITPKPSKTQSYGGAAIGSAIKTGAGVVTSATSTVTGAPKNPVKPSSGGKDGKREPVSAIPVEKHLWGWLPTTIKEGWGAIVELATLNFEDSIKKLEKAGNLDGGQYGDPLAICFAKKNEILAQANIRRVMGDCARLWDQARRLEFYNPSQNASVPVSPSQKVGNTDVNGLSSKLSHASTPKASIPAPVVVPTSK